MQLTERDNFLALMHSRFQKTSGEGHCLFVTGEAGIGKSALIKVFLKQVEDKSVQFTGACDFLFTPRPLAPLYDLALQIFDDWDEKIFSISSRAELFTRFVKEFSHPQKPVVGVFEDVHWADEATLDFIKFLARRISSIKCLFILSWRDEEINQQHQLRNVTGEISSDNFTRLELTPLSREAVYQLAAKKSYDAEEIYSISEGIPFYVNEILSCDSDGVPANIKDSVLSAYNRQEEKVKEAWQLFSVIPDGLELDRLILIDESFHEGISASLAKNILIIKNDKIFFKHELYRRTIEDSLSPFQRIALNKRILSIFLKTFIEKNEIERILHYAKNSNDNELVLKYAPIAAFKASSVGAHLQASRLFFTAIQYSDKKENEHLVQLYESYAYECYLTNQIKRAIHYTGEALLIHRKKNEKEKIGNSLWFLSRLWWFEGNSEQAVSYARQSIKVLEDQPSSKAKAMAYSNMSHLKMTSDQTDECISWGKKAIKICREINDKETFAHALNCMGSTFMLDKATCQKGIELLRRSFRISWKNSFHEQVARAYTALGTNLVTLKKYDTAKKILQKGINYCEEMDLDSLKFYMRGWKCRLYHETGNWKEASQLGENLINQNLFPISKIGALVVVATIKMRIGEKDALPLLEEAKKLAFETKELQRTIPVLIALLEYEWITGISFIDASSLEKMVRHYLRFNRLSYKSRLYFWLRKLQKEYISFNETEKSRNRYYPPVTVQESVYWQKCGCAYEQALALFEGNEEQKRTALQILQKSGATAICGKLKMEMRSLGIKKIPRGLRESTKTNPAKLTNRELDVLQLLQKSIHNKDIAETLFISSKTVDHHVSSILFKLDVNSRSNAVSEALRLHIL
jgi:DNA-binding CsgD family transcriptional regulator